MANTAPVERVYLRSDILIRIIADLQRQALKNPGNERWADLGITAIGDRDKDALRKVSALFEELLGLAQHLAILDMASSYELAARNTIDNHIGKIRKSAEELSDASSIPRYSISAIRQTASYENLTALIDLLKPKIDAGLASDLREIRKARNTFAHGTNVTFAPTVAAYDVRVALKQALEAM